MRRVRAEYGQELRSLQEDMVRAVAGGGSELLLHASRHGVTHVFAQRTA
jgi:hypothetical protein